MPVVPAIKGKIGNINYYQCTMSAMDLISRTQNATEYFSKEDWDNPDKMKPADVEVLQGYVADASITKGYIGLVPEWKNGHEAQVKMVKAYIKTMSLAVQAANPQ